MNFFTSFKWAVPSSFSDSVSKAWFVEGDVLYDHVAAYESNWSTAVKSIDHTIQVRSPARSSGIVDQSTREVFSRNWESEVKIDLFLHMKRMSPVQITTTQGRLYVTLWKGNIDTIFPDKTSHPPMPILAQQVAKTLEKVIGVASTFTGGCATFAMVRDFSNVVLREKYKKLHTALLPHLQKDPIILTPSEAKLADADQIAPTVEVALFPTIGLDFSQLEALVKKAVYVPGKDAKTDMFRLNAHGILI